MAQSQQREISIQEGPEDRVRAAFVKQWEADGCDDLILNVMATARAYGIASLALVAEELKPNVPLDLWKLPDLSIAFSIFDPLNTAGSLVLNQDPNSIDFMKVTAIAVSGQPYHRSRTVTMMNERPVYIAYTASAFGFVGRSVFQRSLFPLKSFVQSMVTDDLVTKKAGVFIAMLSVAGAIVDKIMQVSAGMKRLFVQQATNGNVISIGKDEKIETLNMQNIDGAYGMARKNILENIAVSADMPAKLLNSETFAEGFGEGSEDAKHVARYIDRIRRQMGPLYGFLDRMIQHRAWNEDFFKAVQAEFPEYKRMRYKDAFYQWQNSFTAIWPSLLTEPDSEKVKTDDVRLKAIIATVEVFGPMMDPDNKATLIEWAQEAINQNKMLFQSPLALDAEAIANYEPPMPDAGGPKEPEEPKPFAAADSMMNLRSEIMLRRLDEIAGKIDGPRMKHLDRDSLADLVAIMAQRPEGVPVHVNVHNGAQTEPNRVSNGTKAEPEIIPPERQVRAPLRDRAAYMRDYRARQAGERADAGEFKETDHPREKGGEKGGQFTSKGGGGGSSPSEKGGGAAGGKEGSKAAEKSPNLLEVLNVPAKGGSPGSSMHVHMEEMEHD